MPRVIVKCKYYKNAATGNLGGLMKYIATREGVEKLPDEIKNLAATEKQKNLITEILAKQNQLKTTDEYRTFAKEKSRSAASEFISSAIEKCPNLMKEDSYLRYMGTRPRVEKISGTHGLFSSEGKELNLENEVTKLEQHTGNVYSVIISLKREDAERLNYNNAEMWRDMIRANIDKIAEAHHMPLTNIEWYGAFHNEAHHPHVHMLLYSNDKKNPGFISKKGMDSLRHLFGTEIFKDEIHEIYDKQTSVRNELTQAMRDEFSMLIKDVRNNAGENSDLKFYITYLAECLKKCSGKKQYGYLPKGVKELVDGIVDDISANPKIDRLYELWYKAKCSVYNTYTDNVPERLPLSKEKAFKAIRNALIYEADSLNNTLEAKINTERAGVSGQNIKSTLNTGRTTQNKNSNTKSNNAFSATVSFYNSLANIFRDNYKKLVPDYEENEIDKKLKKEIEQVKNGENIVFD